MKKIRSDKKFNVKVWILREHKLLFRRHCFENHLSMSETGELFLTKLLDKYKDEQLMGVIEKRLPHFKDAGVESHEHISIRITDKYWQRLANLAVIYDLPIVKVATCYFDLCIERYDLIQVGWFWHIDK